MEPVKTLPLMSRFGPHSGPMSRRQVIGVFSMIVAASWRPAAQRATTVQVYKEASCGCCSVWVEHLRKAGFAPTATNVDDMPAIKEKYGVPPGARSCHTAVVDGYIVEGHVPMADIQRLLKQRPAVVGIAVPGMPIGSPGMEVAGMKPQPFDVLTFDKTGETKVFASHRG